MVLHDTKHLINETSLCSISVSCLPYERTWCQNLAKFSNNYYKETTYI